MLRKIVSSIFQTSVNLRFPSTFNSVKRSSAYQIVTSANFATSAAAFRIRESKYVVSVRESEGFDSETASSDVKIKLEGMFASGIPYPNIETHRMIVDGMRYDELPVVNIKATSNNTHVTLANYKGDVLTLSSAGCEGFKNAKKGTNIAAQAAAMSVGQRAKNMDIKYVRVAVKGLGPGRLAAIKGLQLTGLEVVSISDTTIVLFGGPRPRKRRRL